MPAARRARLASLIQPHASRQHLQRLRTHIGESMETTHLFLALRKIMSKSAPKWRKPTHLHFDILITLMQLSSSHFFSQHIVGYGRAHITLPTDVLCQCTASVQHAARDGTRYTTTRHLATSLALALLLYLLRTICPGRCNVAHSPADSTDSSVSCQLAVRRPHSHIAHSSAPSSPARSRAAVSRGMLTFRSAPRVCGFFPT
jgi:hypothetical protein